MSPEDAIASLNADLAEAGQSVTLQRAVSGVVQSVVCQAFVRSYRLNDQELVGGIDQDILLVTLSPSEIAAAGWPGVTWNGSGEDPRLPTKGDFVVVRNRVRRIDVVEPLPIQGTWVRFDMKCLG